MEPDYRYQNRQQNFNQAPTPIPAEPQKQKKKGCPIAIVIICLILAFGGVGFGIYEMMTAGSTQGPITENCNCPECQNNDTSEDDEIKDYIDSISDYIKTEFNYNATKTYDQYNPWYKIEGTETITMFKKSYGLDTEYINNENIKTEISNKIKEKLISDGFELANYRYMDGENYIKDEITCIKYDGATEVGCSKNSWKANEENTALLKDLVAAYKDVNNQEPTVINADAENIKKSSYENYEYIYAGIGAAALFYRENQTSEWKFLFARQNIAECKSVSDLERKLLANTENNSCYNEETGLEEKY